MIIAIIQARMDSERLPGKSLLPLGDSTILGQTIRRVRQARRVDQVVVATPDQAIAIEAIRHKAGIHVHRGPQWDVLSRYFIVARNTMADTIVRITADCPMVCPELIDKMVGLYNLHNVDYVYGLPDGLDVEVFSRWALNEANERAKQPELREHVTPWIRQHKHALYEAVVTLNTKLSIDTRDDYDEVCLLWDILPENFRFKDIANILN